MHNLHFVDTFVKVVETNSFTRAAKSKGISRAAASKQVRELEKELGTVLLDRTTRGVALTEEGQLVFEECRRILDNVAEVEAMVSSLKEEPSGHLFVVSGPVFAHKYIVPCLDEFSRLYPKINLKLEFRHLMPNMVEEKVDIVVGVFGAGPLDAMQRTVIRTRRLFCASPAYLEKAGKPEKLEDLLEHPVIIHPVSPSDTTLKTKSGKIFNIAPKVVMNDQLAVRWCALNNMGIVLIQQHVIEKELQEGSLVEVLSEHMEQECTIPIHMYYFKRRFIHSKIRTFVDFVMKNISREAG